ncbi:unnamed protein product, partial [Gulo gulo]
PGDQERRVPGPEPASNPRLHVSKEPEPKTAHTSVERKGTRRLWLSCGVSAQPWRWQVTIPRSSQGRPHGHDAGRNTPHAKGCARHGSADAKFSYRQNGSGRLGGCVGDASAFGSGHDPRVFRSSPVESCFSLCFCPSPLLVLSLCLSQVNKKIKS